MKQCQSYPPFLFSLHYVFARIHAHAPLIQSLRGMLWLSRFPILSRVLSDPLNFPCSLVWEGQTIVVGWERPTLKGHHDLPMRDYGNFGPPDLWSFYHPNETPTILGFEIRFNPASWWVPSHSLHALNVPWNSRLKSLVWLSQMSMLSRALWSTRERWEMRGPYCANSTTAAFQFSPSALYGNASLGLSRRLSDSRPSPGYLYCLSDCLWFYRVATLPRS